MSASWMKFQGMRDVSNSKELRRRTTFAPNLGEPTALKWKAAASNDRKELVAKLTAPVRSMKRGIFWHLKVSTSPRILKDVPGKEPEIEKMGWLWNLRRRLFGAKWEVDYSPEEIAALKKADMSPGEAKYEGRWTDSYVGQLAAKAVAHVKVQTARFTQWMLK